MDLKSGTALTVQSEQAGITSRLQFPVDLIDWKLSLEDLLTPSIFNIPFSQDALSKASHVPFHLARHRWFIFPSLQPTWSTIPLAKANPLFSMSYLASDLQKESGFPGLLDASCNTSKPIMANSPLHEKKHRGRTSPSNAYGLKLAFR